MKRFGALKIVHQAGLVHRDAHPGNIMIQQDGKAVLIDFGIASQTMPTAGLQPNGTNIGVYFSQRKLLINPGADSNIRYQSKY